LSNVATLNEYVRETFAGNFPKCPCGANPDAPHRTAVRGTWCHAHNRMQAWRNGTGPQPFSVFVKGNHKLPFFALSALPVFTCPGAGECAAFCYSFKAWRYPGAFMRQLGVTLMLRSASGREVIRTEWHKLPANHDVRLFVDGDIEDRRTLEFILRLCYERPDLRAYGYSKSWAVFLAHADDGGAWPANYVLNLSSGGIYGAAVRERMQALPIVRGQFLAMHSAIKMPNRRTHQEAFNAYAAALRTAAREAGHARTFVCPGKCGDCMGNGAHACGTRAMDGVAVLIGIH
jgi:hypothetical protein